MLCCKPGPEAIKLFSCSTQISMNFFNAHKYKNITNTEVIKLFSGSDKLRMLFLLHITVEMPTVVGISTFMSRKKFMLS